MGHAKTFGFIFLVVFLVSSCFNESTKSTPEPFPQLAGSTAIYDITYEYGKFNIYSDDLTPGVRGGLYQIRKSGDTYYALRLHRGWYKNMQGYFPKSEHDVKSFKSLNESFEFITKDFNPKELPENSFDSMDELVNHMKGLEK